MRLVKYLDENILRTKLGTFGTDLYNALNKANIEVISLEPNKKFNAQKVVLQILVVKYKGKEKRVKLTGNYSAEQIVKKIIG